MDHLITTNTQLAHTLRKRRKTSGESQSMAANRSGLLSKTISLLENQPGKCSVDTLIKYLSSLNLEIVLRDKPIDITGNETEEW